MKKQNETQKHLRLHRETVRELQPLRDTELANVAGGGTSVVSRLPPPPGGG